MTELLEYIMNYRKVWIRGRLGYGKTSLAFMIAEALLRERLVDGIVSNCPNQYPTSVNGPDDGTLFNKCVVYDEAGQELDARTSMTNSKAYGAFARKLGIVYLFPSVVPVDRRLRDIEISPAYKMLGKTKYNYIITASAGTDKDKTQGSFTIDLKQSYGKYSTSYIPTGDCGIQKRFALTYYLETGEKYDVRTTADEKRQRIEGAVSNGGGDPF